jgi:uncharacterized membrane protein YbhN (UPF0104 family)
MSRADLDVPEAPRRNWRGLAVRLAGSATLLALLALFLPTEELLGALRQVQAGAWAFALPAYLSLHLMGVVKWRLMVNAAGGGLSLRSSARCYYYGLFGNTFLPSVIGGDAIRVAAAFRLARSKSGVAVGSVAERLLDAASLVCVAGVGVLLLPRELDEQTRDVFLGFSGLVGLLAALALATLVVVVRVSARARLILAKARAALSATARQPASIIFALCLGIGLQFLLVLLNAWLGRQCGIDIPLAAWLFAWPTAKISALVPVTQGGLGVREAALAALLVPLGVAPAMSVAAGLAFQAVIISGGLIGGLLAMALGRTQHDVEPR